MSNVIAFLEAMGRDAVLPAQGEEFTAAAKAAGLDDDVRMALLSGDAATIAAGLGGRPKMICALFPADDEPQKDGEDQPTDEPGEEKEAEIRH
ncbi:hypothetical protein [Arenimonas composti]|uniref:Uncharacterized protein n=1 Tax=Arenimonas composti TR7-09 = DSM 18010 TaxID=1121013 RepID=A0A091BYN0_9GAMM|nr:hypothetical protein [Arenimonas composti]KFN49430.1 hypothetical protein P873_10680 [Arenimonas composti TR7-09 = DSM 18010]